MEIGILLNIYFNMYWLLVLVLFLINVFIIRLFLIEVWNIYIIIVICVDIVSFISSLNVYYCFVLIG